MGKEDINLKNYFNDAGRYADLWNGGVFEGKQIVKPDELQEVNPSVFMADHHAVMERSRDVVMKQNLKGHRFILQPVVTLVAYWGEEPWDGPVNLHDMIDFGSESGQGNCLENAEIQKLIPEYPLHFIDMSQVEHPEYFKTELRPFLELYQRRNDKTKFIEYIRENESVQKMDDESWYMLSRITHSDKLMKAVALKNDKNEENGNMCKAIDDFYNDGVEEGKAIGEAIGKAIGEAIGKAEGKAEGKAIGKAEIVASVRKMYTRNYNAEEIADLLDQDKSGVEQILNLITDNPKDDNLQIAKRLMEREGVA